MKRKFLVLLCIVMIAALAIASCEKKNTDDGTNNNSGDTCEHTFSESWSTNSTEHWHAATCEHTEQKSGLAPHADTDEDGKCDACAYSMPHTHTFADTWSADDDNHWHTATCSHKSEKSDLAAHTDAAPADGACDVCGATVELNIDPANFAEIIETIVANAGSVNGGVVRYTYDGNSNAGDGTSDVIKTARYEFGDGSLYLVIATQAKTSNAADGETSVTDVVEYWYELVSADEVFGVVKETADGEITLNAGATLDSLKGYYCSVSTLTDAYGPENLLASLYAISQRTDPTGTIISSNYVENVVDDASGDIYVFTFNSLVLNRNVSQGTAADYYEVSVAFQITEHGVLESIQVICDCYTNSLQDESDWDFDFDPATETIAMRSTATADTYGFVFSQIIGNRTYVNEHTKSKYIPESFEIFTDEERTINADGAFNIVADTVNYLYLGGYLPEGTSISFIADSFVADIDTDDAMIFTNAMNGSVLVKVNTAGTYTLTVSAGDITKTVTVTVTAPDDGGNGSEVIRPENSIVVTITDNNTYVDVATFTAPESGSYTFFIPAGCGAWDKIESDSNPFGSVPYVDPYMQSEGGSFTVELAKDTTYEFYVRSPEKDVDVVITYNFVAHEVNGGSGGNGGDGGSASSVASGTYIGTANNQGNITLVIDGEAGTLTVTLAKGTVVNYTFTVDAGVVTLSNANGPISSDMAIYFGSLKINNDGNPIEFLYNGYTYAVSAEGAGGSNGDGDDVTTELVIGSNTITVTETDIANESIEIPFIVTDEGTYTFASNDLMVNILDSTSFLLGRSEAYLTPGNYVASVYLGLVSEAGDYTLNLVYTAPTNDGDDGDGTESSPFVVDGMIDDITFVSNTNDQIYYIFTADKTGTVTFTYPTADSWYAITELNANGENTENGTSGYLTNSFTFDLVAGTQYKIALGTWSVSGEVTVTVSFTEA